MKVIRRAVSLGILGVLVSVAGRAFDYDEHKYLSNAALRIALAEAGLLDQPVDVRRFLEPAAIGQGRSFGDLTALADYVRGVDTFFESSGVIRASDDGYCWLDWDHISGLKRDWLRFLQSAHLNEAHFQSGALATYTDEHDAAVLLARDGRLGRAMVMEAHALHFLQDFHAPGHIMTTRAIIADYVAIAAHEKYNHKGLRVFPRRVAELLERLEFVTEHFDELGLRQLAQRDAIGLELAKGDFEELSSELASGTAIKLYGDSSLRQHHVEEAFLVLMSADSIRQVLEANAPKSDAAGRGTPTACWYLGYDNLPGTCDGQVLQDSALRLASTPYSTYDTAHLRPFGFFFTPGTVVFLNTYSEFGSHSAEPAGGRSEISLETLLASTLPPSYFHHSNESRTRRFMRDVGFVGVSVTYGAAKTFGNGGSYGALARVALAVPRIDMQISYESGVRWYAKREGAPSRSFPHEYAVETGFGFLLLHLGVLNDTSRDTNTGAWNTARRVRTGVSLALPRSIYTKPFALLFH